MTVTFKNCWIGTYVGDGCYEGGSCPDITITNVPESKDLDELFTEYINVYVDEITHLDEDEKEYDITKSYIRGKKPVKITKRCEIIDCIEPYIEIDFNFLMDLDSNDTLYEVVFSNGKPTRIMTFHVLRELIVDNSNFFESVEEIWSLDYDGDLDELVWEQEEGEMKVEYLFR